MRSGGNYSRVEVLGREIKFAIGTRQRLTWSIGIASTKAVAKIASDIQKPDGLTVVPRDAVAEFLAPISVRKIFGVGPKTAERLNELGIESIADLQEYNREDLVELLGAYEIGRASGREKLDI